MKTKMIRALLLATLFVMVASSAKALFGQWHPLYNIQSSSPGTGTAHSGDEYRIRYTLMDTQTYYLQGMIYLYKNGTYVANSEGDGGVTEDVEYDGVDYGAQEVTYHADYSEGSAMMSDYFYLPITAP